MTKRIAIIDDDVDTAKVMTRLIKEAGYEIAGSSENAKNGLLMLNNTLPDMVLLDVMLPDMLGTDLCVMIRKNEKLQNCLIVLISGKKINSDDMAYGLEIGADDYISRPIESRRFIARIKALFRLTEGIQIHREPKYYESFNLAYSKQTADVYQQKSIREAYPDEFNRFVKQYVEIIDLSVQARIFKTTSNSTDQTHLIAQQLGFLKARARDAIEIHKEAISKQIDPPSAQRTFLIREESRIILIELLGYLANYYRNLI